MAMTVPADPGGALDAGLIHSGCRRSVSGRRARALIDSAARDEFGSGL